MDNEPILGVMKIGEYGTAEFFKVECDCGNQECSHTIEVEADDCNNVMVHVYLDLTTDYWSEVSKIHYDNKLYDFVSGLLNWFTRNLKHSFDIWFKGKIETQTTIVMDEKVAKNYVNTLLTASDRVKHVREVSRNLRKKDETS